MLYAQPRAFLQVVNYADHRTPTHTVQSINAPENKSNISWWSFPTRTWAGHTWASPPPGRPNRPKRRPHLSITRAGLQNAHFIFVHNHNSLDSRPRNLNSGTCTRLTSPHHSCIISVIFPSSQARFSPMSTRCFMGRGGSGCNARKQECHVYVRALPPLEETGIRILHSLFSSPSSDLIVCTMIGRRLIKEQRQSAKNIQQKMDEEQENAFKESGKRMWEGARRPRTHIQSVN